jgi:phosphoglycerate dehydrogenase-like enzyme
MKEVLITDTLFVFPEHEERLRGAGLGVTRLPKPDASEDELIEALQGKQGYILGGIEKVTDRVIENAAELEAIVFTGTAWKGFIPGWQSATARGISIANAPHANAEAVAEWAFSAGLAMIRNLFVLGRTGEAAFQTTPGLSELSIGVVGLGHIGSRLADLFHAAGVREVSYWNRTPKESPYHSRELEEVFRQSDLIAICVSSEAGAGFIDAEKLAFLKDGAILTSLTESVVDARALLTELGTGRIRAYLDWTPKDEAFLDLPVETFYCSNESTAFNTHAANRLASDWVTESIINLLSSGEDQRKVN